MNRPTVLILASDPAFARAITANWPQDSTTNCDGPEFTVLDEGFSSGLENSHYDLAIADASSVEKIKVDKIKNDKRKPLNQQSSPHTSNDLRHPLVAAGKPAILIHTNPARGFCDLHGAVVELRREAKSWPALAGLIGHEILRRRQAESRASDAEKISAAAQSEAVLGRYMVEMRTNVNNALTTVLGNAELLVHEPGLPSTVQAQADAIRSMALRLHEVFQRFSSLEKELAVAAREPKALNAAAGRR
jgi:hypothetical protein